jgi:hypothetical protein
MTTAPTAPTTGPATGPPAAPWPRRVDVAAAVFAVALAVHAFDHLRRGMDVLTPSVFWLGNFQTVVAVVTLVLVVRRHRLALPFAVFIGFASAFGFVVVHLLPDFGPVSDSFCGAHPAPHVTGLSWFAALFEIGADLLFGAFALDALRRARRTRSVVRPA